MDLRPYQADASDKTDIAWSKGSKNVVVVLPTGGGKSLLSGHKVKQQNGASCIVAHREELTSQMALAVARCGVRHRIIGNSDLVKTIVQDQMTELGKTLFDPNAPVAVAGVDTLIRRKEQLKAWLPQVGLWVMDEAHHVLRENKWGEAVRMFPNARGFGVTATPERSDGKGIGSSASGYFDEMVVGPSMRWLIENNYLCDYIYNGQCHIYCPPNDLDLSKVDVSDKTGEYVQPQLKKAVRDSHIVGDIVKHYLQIARGRLGVVFATDLETAADITANFQQHGVRAEFVSGKTPGAQRSELIRRFRRRDLDVLVNVDLFGEGFDLPALEVVMFARPTKSYALYCQMFGRALRWLQGKLHAVIIDHVNNVLRHGLPDAPRTWSLGDRQKKAKNGSADDDIKLKICAECTRPYERVLIACPYCGSVPVPGNRSSPLFVDGDLTQLDIHAIEHLKSKIEHVDQDFTPVMQAMKHAGAPPVAIAGAKKQHDARREAQQALRTSMAWWAGHQEKLGRTIQESYKRFYLTFGVDVMSAQSLGKPEAIELADKINNYLARTV